MTGPGDGSRPTVAVWKFTSCDGCQLQLVDCAEGVLATGGGPFRIAHFTELTPVSERGPYDLSLVEGSVTTPDEIERIHRIRSMSHTLVTIGTCATAGGIQALRNLSDAGELAGAAYPRPELLATLATSTPASAHVHVDVELPGCPIECHQLVEVLAAHQAGRRPVVPDHAVCHECKAAGTVCVLVAGGTPCLGPVTRAGCGARCPAVGRGCFGCFGPLEGAPAGALTRALARSGTPPADTAGLLAAFGAGVPVPPPHGRPAAGGRADR